MKLYKFYENNSGGVHLTDGRTVLIEATTAAKANTIALDNGIYFNGCDKGLDCDCCGDRWAEAEDENYVRYDGHVLTFYYKSKRIGTEPFNPDEYRIIPRAWQ